MSETALHSFIVHGLSQSLTLLPLHVLTPENRRLLNWSESGYIICSRYTAKSISEKTHDIIWKLADIGEEIPYYAV